MKLIVGLGNPGKEYENTRHNLGFLVVQAFGPFNFDKKCNGWLSKVDDTLFLMPQTFMNESGLAVQKAAHYYKISPADIWVCHDEIDLPLGKLRVSFDSSSAGHKGVGSIIKTLGTQSFYRFRMGIASAAKGQTPTEQFVLQPFNSDENPVVTKMIHQTQMSIANALSHGIEYIIKELSI